MVNIPSRIAIPLAGCAVLLAIASPAHAQVGGVAAASDAYSASAFFSSLSMSTQLGPVNEAAGVAPPAYDVVKVLPAFSQTIAVPPLVPTAERPVAADFSVTATALRSEAASKGIELDYVQATGKTTVAKANMQIVSVVPPGTTIPVISYLDVTASKVATTATFSQQFPLSPTLSGTTTFGSLKISGTLLGGETVSYSGSAPPNTVLYRSPTSSANETPAVTITAHQQIIIATAGPVSFERIIVNGLDINLSNADINGSKVTGNIILGEASAQ